VGTGIVENNGTYDMNGNYQEWLEDNFRFCGGEFRLDEDLMRSTSLAGYTYPSRDGSFTGFRVVSISSLNPEIRGNETSDQIQIQWHSSSGHVYQVQHSTNLLSSNWLDLSAITATGTTSTVTNQTHDSDQKFYRIICK
jgi:hypothetical protein